MLYAKRKQCVAYRIREFFSLKIIHAVYDDFEGCHRLLPNNLVIMTMPRDEFDSWLLYKKQFEDARCKLSYNDEQMMSYEMRMNAEKRWTESDTSRVNEGKVIKVASQLFLSGFLTKEMYCCIMQLYIVILKGFDASFHFPNAKWLTFIYPMIVLQCHVRLKLINYIVSLQ